MTAVNRLIRTVTDTVTTPTVPTLTPSPTTKQNGEMEMVTATVTIQTPFPSTPHNGLTRTETGTETISMVHKAITSRTM